ncbi:hypothetical protein PROVRUST_06234 [Providencia rustigianii DSM 4541]|uniref:Uncharacterized protein n=1 Tax=Providencia rustigianii DSM 4541 TaxID=500637 RepID=D1P211_9GAMM|nr:hypothetical protein PROVRUST_06234 [Providencia rustigianii DSM 4541]
MACIAAHYQTQITHTKCEASLIFAICLFLHRNSNVYTSFCVETAI